MSRLPLGCSGGPGRGVLLFSNVTDRDFRYRSESGIRRNDVWHRWTAAAWDAGQQTPACYKWWRELDAPQVAAAAALGYNTNAWNAEKQFRKIQALWRGHQLRTMVRNLVAKARYL
jgi:hypothetical protein